MLLEEIAEVKAKMAWVSDLVSDFTQIKLCVKRLHWSVWLLKQSSLSELMGCGGLFMCPGLYNQP